MTLDPTEYYAARGITEKWVMEQRGLERTDEGILIPFYSLPDGLPSGYEVRLDVPTEDGRKFTRPYGQRASLNIHPSQVEALRDHGQPLFIVEGTTRADALAQRGIPAVSVAGCWGFMSGKEALADFDSLTVRGREVIIGLDGDVLTNPDVNAALHRLGLLMQRKGAASVDALVLPDNQGLDDWLAGGGSVLNLARHQQSLEAVAVLKPKKLNPAQRARRIVGDINDTVLAERFVNGEHNRLRYLYRVGSWATYADGRWVQEAGDAMARSQVTDMMIDIAERFKDDSDVRDMLLSSNKVSSVTLAVKSNAKAHGDPEEFDKDPWLFNVANGTLDLRTGMLMDHDPLNLLWGKSPTAWNLNAVAPRFHRFMEEIIPDPATRRTVQEILGASLPGVTLAEILPVFIGTGRNGKSVLLNTVGAVLGNEFFGVVDKQLLTGSRFEAHPENVMSLRGKRLVFASETEAGEKFAASNIKMLTGGDHLRGRFMRENTQTFKPTHSMVLVTNNEPRVDDTGAAIWARLKRIPFTVSFLGREDPMLTEKLGREHEGILRWLVDGLHRVLANGSKIDFSDEVTASTDGWKQSENSLLGFVQSGLVVNDPLGKIPSSEFNSLYGGWCADNDTRPLRTTALKREMLSLGYTKDDNYKSRGWAGLRVPDGVGGSLTESLTELELAMSGKNPQVKGPFSSYPDGADGVKAYSHSLGEIPGQLDLFSQEQGQDMAQLRQVRKADQQTPRSEPLSDPLTESSTPSDSHPTPSDSVRPYNQVDRWAHTKLGPDDLTPIVAKWASLLRSVAEPCDREIFDDIMSRPNRPRDRAKEDALSKYTLTLSELVDLAEGQDLPRSPLDLRRSLYRVREELDTNYGLGVYLRRTDGPIGQFRRDKKDKSDKGKEALLICEWM